MNEWSNLLRLIDPVSGFAGWVTFHSLVPLERVPPIPPMVLQLLNRASVKVPRMLSPDDLAGMPVSETSQRSNTAILDPNWWRCLRLTGLANTAEVHAMPLRLRRLELLGSFHRSVSRQLLCSMPCRTLVAVVLSGCGSAFIENVVSLTSNLKELTLGGCQLSDDHLRLVAGIRTLTTLAIDDYNSRLSTVSALSESKSLVILTLRSRITGDGFAGLERILTLTRLNLCSCPGLSSVNHLGSSTSLVDIDLSKSRVSSEGLEGLERIPTLRRLNLSFCSYVTSASCLAGSTSLVELNLEATSVTLAGLRGLGRIPTLEKLNLLGCRSLTRIPSLADLRREVADGPEPTARGHRAEHPLDPWSVPSEPNTQISFWGTGPTSL